MKASVLCLYYKIFLFFFFFRFNALTCQNDGFQIFPPRKTFLRNYGKLIFTFTRKETYFYGAY